jgi:hypothetical protein
MTNFYKCFDSEMKGPFSGVALEIGVDLPPVEGPLVMCENGYHFCTEEHLIHWLNCFICPITVEGEWIEYEMKRVARQIHIHPPLKQWNSKTTRYFACDCAERVLKYFEADYPNDKRPQVAIEMARQFANGEVTDQQRATASDAARDAASGGANAAASAAQAAGATAWNAAWDAETKWQSQRLMEIIL